MLRLSKDDVYRTEIVTHSHKKKEFSELVIHKANVTHSLLSRGSVRVPQATSLP